MVTLLGWLVRSDALVELPRSTWTNL